MTSEGVADQAFPGRAGSLAPVAFAIALAFSSSALAAPVAFNFAAAASPDVVVNGDFNAAQPGDAIAGSFVFDDAIIAAALAAHEAIAEYPDASIAFTLTRPNGATYFLETRPVVETTTFADMRLAYDFGNSLSHLNFWNLESSTDLYPLRPVFISFTFDGIIAVPEDVLTLEVTVLDYRYRIEPFAQPLVNYYYADVVISRESESVSEPSALMLLGAGAAALGSRRRRSRAASAASEA